jgi:2-hydroxychromene-2-carboxylate isomerase
VRARAALRVAALADERGRGAAFVQAAARLAWAGGYDLEDPEALVEAAGAAGLAADEALAAAADRSRDAPMIDEAGRLRVLGVCDLPAVRVGQRIVAGEERLAEAALLARRSAAAARRLPRAT